MATRYGSTGVRVEGQRPLEPEDEMRLLLEAPVWPRGARKAVVIGLALMGVALVAVSLSSTDHTLFRPVVHACLFLTPLVSLLSAELKHRRRVAKLRAAGYDVEGAATAHLRVADAPLIRVAAEPVTESIDDECALDERGRDDETTSSKAAARR